MAEESFSNALTQDLGGVPAWVWGAGAGVLIGGWYYLQNRNAPLTQTVYSPEDLQPGAADPTNSDWGLPEGPLGDWLRENPGYAGYPQVGLPNRGVPAPITNAQWAKLASDNLLTTGADPGLVSTALEKYLGRQWLTDAEKAVVDTAKRLFGELPEGPIGYVPKPTTPQLTAPTNVRAAYTYTTGFLLTWSGVPGAQQYLVSVNGKLETTRPATPQHLITGLKSKTQYSISVTPRANMINGPSTTVTLRTK